MNLSKLPNRVQYVILLSIVLALLGFYSSSIFMPKLNELRELKTQAEQSEARVKVPNIPEEPGENPQALQARIEVLESEVVAMRRTLSEAGTSLAPTNSQEMLLMISEAARVSGVRVMENEPYHMDAQKGELPYRLQNELERPFQRMRIEGSFTALQAFVVALKNLPWQATIMKFEIRVASPIAPQGVPQPITANMIVAM